MLISPDLSKVHWLTFSVAVIESTKKAGVAQKEAFLKEADKRAKVIFDKADANRDKKIAFEGIKNKKMIIEKAACEPCGICQMLFRV